MLTNDPAILDALLAPARHIEHTVLLYIEGVAHDITPDVISIDMEQDTGQGDVPFGNVTYNSCTIKLDNMSRNYTLNNPDSPYYGKLKDGMLIQVSYHVWVCDSDKRTLPGGTYYSDSWKAETDQNTASVTGLDKLSLIGRAPVPDIPAKKKIAVRDALKLFFTLCGLKKEEYYIDPAIRGAYEYIWTFEDNLRTTLEKLAQSAMVDIFVDRKNLIKAVSLTQKSTNCLVLSDSDVIISTKASPTYNNLYNACKVHYEKVKSLNASTVGEITIKIPPGVTKLDDILFSTVPIVQITGIGVRSKGKVTVNSYETTGRKAIIEVLNHENKQLEVTCSIYGLALESEKTEHFLQKEQCTNILEITCPGLITQGTAKTLTHNLLELFSTEVPTIEVDIRMVPVLELYDRITINSSSIGISKDYYIIGMSEDMCEGLMGTLTLVSAESRQLKSYVCIGPGQYIQLGGK